MNHDDNHNNTNEAYKFYILSNIRIKLANSIQPLNFSKEHIYRQSKKNSQRKRQHIHTICLELNKKSLDYKDLV